MADIMPLSEAAPRPGTRRSDRLTVADAFWLAAICAWPVSFALFFVQAAIEAVREMGRRR